MSVRRGARRAAAGLRTRAARAWSSTRARDAALIVGGATLPVLTLRPLQNAPFVDDWTYAWSVEHLLQTGELRILDWSTSLHVAQILWGALFCLPFGFSFTALRLSTWVAAVLGLLGLHALLRELGASRRDALIGVAALGAFPVFFILSFSFMTDVPFLAAATWSLLALVRAVRTGSPAALAGAVGLAGVAVAIRPLGVVLAGAIGLTLALEPGGPGRRLRRAALAIAPVAAALALLALARPALTAHRADLAWVVNSPEWRAAHLAYGLALLPGSLGRTVTVVATTLAVVLAPVALGGLSREARRAAPLAAGLGALLLGLVLAGVGHPVALEPASTWSVRELGQTELLVGPREERRPPAWWRPVMVGAGAGTLALALAPAAGAWRRREARPLLWAGAGYVALLALLWLFHDRYVLPLVPIALALRLAGPPLVRPRAALLGVAVLAAVSVLGTRDQLQYSRALWRTVAEADRQGIPPRDLDGGYVVNGWRQYAHPERARRAPDGGVLVPWVNDAAPTPYAILNRPPPDGRVLHVEPYRRLLGRSGRLYLVERPAASPDAAGT